MDVNDLFEAKDPELTGYLDIPTLTRMLPDITDLVAFTSAINKLRTGQDDILTRPEQTQLAAGFISLIREPAPQKLVTLNKMMTIQAVPQNTSNQTPNQAENPSQ